ncbi:MAG: hypothetical protein E7111_00470 [Bacteroidales bacterium]|nr:hypothetical protein [Bacteroidales bacterium]
MKKNIFILLALIAAGCQKNEPVHTPEAENGAYAIEVTSPSAVESKTTLVDNGDYYSVNWTASDVISVNGQESADLTVDTGNARKAVFSFADEVSAPYCSVYPASAYKPESLVDGQATVVIPAEQTYVEGDFDPAAAIMIGYSETAGKLAFEHAVAYMQIKVTTTDGAAVKSVSIKGNAKEAMSGEFTANFAEATLVNDTNDESSVSVVCESGFASGKEVIIAIPARTYASGVSVTLTDVNGHSKLLKSTVAFAANAGVVYSTEMELKPKGIWGVNDYIAFANAVNAGDYDAFIGEDGEVNLMADITLESGNFKYVSVEFNGTFDGNGHTLTSPERTTPLFAEIGAEGVVKNLNTAGTYSSFANGYWCGASSFAKINRGTIENCNNSVNTELDYSAPAENGLVLGCFVGQNGGTIKNCKNTGYTRVNATLGTIAANTTFSTPCIAGGFAAIGHTVTDKPGVSSVGYTAHTGVTPGKFEKCVNEGDLKITVVGPARKTTISAVGGICGLVVLDGVEFDSCSNSGHVSRISNGEGSNDGSSCVGGILGQGVQSHSSGNPHCVEANNGYNTVIKNCTNSGTILHNPRYSVVIELTSAGADGKAARHATAGGIAGLINGRSDAKATISGCTNSGVVTDGWSGQRHFIGGISGYSKNATFTNNVMAGSLESYQGLSIGVAGGIVGAAYDGVTISGGSSKPSFDCVGTSNVDLCAGLVVGVSLANVSISDMTVGVGTKAKIKNKNVESTITKDNYKVYNELVNTTTAGDNTNYATTVTNVTWVD